MSSCTNKQARVIYKSGDVQYVCTAPAGTATTEAKWCINKIDESVSTETQSLWAVSTFNGATDVFTAISLADVSNLTNKEYK